jgi:predicted DNA-binding helix-hairpin-helix protein
MVGNASGVDLNNAGMQDLSRIGGLGRVLATRIIEHRPILRWDDLKKIDGFTNKLVNDLRGSGAKLGRPRQSTARRTYRRVLREPGSRPARQTASKSGQASNIFSGEGQLKE